LSPRRPAARAYPSKLRLALHTVSTAPSGKNLYEYDYVLRFVGAGTLAGVQEALRRIPAARLADAYEARE
jgi:hypothetical protein